MVQLDDADPAIKVYAITYLRADRVTNALSRISRLMNDRDVGVQFAAAVTIEAVADEDFGWESWMGMEEAERDAAFDKTWAWWKANQNSFTGEVPRAKKVAGRQLPELKFLARDHSAISSVAWRGQPTFVQFFATYCSSCDQVLPEVQKLSQQMVGREINVVGVSLDAIPDDHNHFFDVVEVEGHEGHDHSHHGHGHAHHEVDTEAIMEASSKLLVARRLGYRVFYDVTGEATAATDGGEIPVGIFLDADGRLVRRFVGPRSAPTLTAMLKADFPEAFNVSRE